MTDFKIQDIFKHSFDSYSKGHFISAGQHKAASAIMKCKTPECGCNASICTECGHMEIHYSSCRNRNCPNCQAVKTQIWVDKRRSEVIDTPYFHVVFTLPHELNSLIYCNQSLLYGLLHKCCSQTLLELSSNPRFLGAVPGIIQVLHTWNQEIDYHVHMHCIVSGGGLTKDKKIRTSKSNFFIPVTVLRDKFQGKFLSLLNDLYTQDRLTFSASCAYLAVPSGWKEFKDSLYKKDWCPYIKETFNGFGNAIEYLGKYTHKIAISNSRIISLSETEIVFSARGIKPSDPRRTVTLSNEEFIRRYLMHVLPTGFQKIRYYGFLNNRMKTKNLKIIFTLQGHQRFRRRYSGMSIAELLKTIWNISIACCPVCGSVDSMKPSGRCYAKPS